MRLRFMRWLFVLVVTGPLCVYLVGNGAVGLFDRDEPRYAQTSRQMLQSGDWVVPRFLDKVRTAKPVLIYWCQASAMSVLGDNRFAARLPSALGMAATVTLLAVAVSRAVGRRRGLWCAFILSSCVMAMVSAKMCLTDAVLLLFITTSQLCVYRLWRRGPDVATVVVLGVSAGLAGLTKGPVALGINAATVAALWGLGRTLGRAKASSAATEWSGNKTVAEYEADLPALKAAAARSAFRAWHWPIVLVGAGVVMAAVAGPWLVLIQQRAPEFLQTAIGHDVVDRMSRGHEGHSGPPGLYALLVWGTFFPWSLLLPAALVWGWKRRHVPTTRFALAAFIGPWVMFELIATKLPHYVLPTYPALSYLVADMLVRASRGRVPDLRSRGFRVAAWVWAGLICLAGVAVPVGLFWIGETKPAVAAGGLSIALVAIVTGIATARRFGAGRPLAAARAMGGGALLVVAVGYTLLLPGLTPLSLTRDVAKLMIDEGGYGAAGYMIDFKEPSLAFEQGGGLREQSDSDYLNDTPPDAWPTWVVTTRRVWDATRPDVRDQWTVIGSRRGVAYSDGGETHDVLVLQKQIPSKPEVSDQ